ncbi:outer membrane beta-barrel protein [Pyruvatibacter mobilis]|uniref:Outer membrane beta-barrel protein n=1 Tax=Pyruvatibacter mobilis TaxID=1712261 RepID=A0A845QDK7_9HYPH|nr:outer membrane beta-barrel protein [Pyruvatibacter mobilis]NBG96652.1 outer membrane beta-barrel protein [Pyruvatibacter mobilis]QJD74346.1 porin family protein [Pyruvatibacter mobilis]GGD06134.1 P44/Msp2 family outer membrane protein [Pyruvatibacter mobilis]
MKKTNFAAAAIAAAALLGANAAQAEDGNWYVSAGGGANWIGDQSSNGVTADYDAGYTVLGAVGYDFGDSETGSFRVEGEISWTKNDVDQVTINGVNANIGGDTEQWGFMMNALYDFMPGSTFRPYIGAGLGVVDGETELNRAGVTVSGNSTEFAYRGLVGVGIGLGENTTLDLGYRHTRVTGDNDDFGNNTVIAQVRFGL